MNKRGFIDSAQAIVQNEAVLIDGSIAPLGFVNLSMAGEVTLMNIELLKRLSETPGVAGREERVREILAAEAEPLFDEIRVDCMGNLIANRKAAVAGAPRVLIACHMDEIGFYVKHIDDKGYARLAAAGGFDPRTLLARRVLVCTRDGDLEGLLNPTGRPIHIAKDEEKKKIPEIDDLFIDFCLPADQVKQKVRIGDPVSLVQPFGRIGSCYTGKCLDNRVGGFVLLEAMKKVTNPRFEVVFVATVQEEVGLRGAGPAAYACEPQIAIALDTTLCVDLPGVPEDERVTRQGDGVAIKVMDSGTISDRGLVDELVELGHKRDIPCQLSILPRGGTDAAAMQRSRGGVRAISLAVPTRYIHTVTECIHERDLASAIDLLAAWLDG